MADPVTVDGPVGKAKPGSWWRTKVPTNFKRDQEKVLKLLSEISVTDGGQREKWLAVPLSDEDGKCPQALTDGIFEFQKFWKDKGKFTNIDAVVDPGGNTLKRMNEIVGASPPPTPDTGVHLARSDVSRARGLIQDAIRKLKAYQVIFNGGNPTAPQDPVVEDALRVHFRRNHAGVITAPPFEPITGAALAHIINHYVKMDAVLVANATSFIDEEPVDKNGQVVAAASNLDSKIIQFSHLFHNTTTAETPAIGSNSRAAILIHEGYHSVDAAKRSAADDVHISEFAPTYESQPAEKSLHNPSSYASFAAHVSRGSDPKPRFGLDAKGRFF